MLRRVAELAPVPVLVRVLARGVRRMLKTTTTTSSPTIGRSSAAPLAQALVRAQA
jgi:hypothetical protein